MKLDSRGFASLLANPGRMRAVLLFGEDAGMVRERGKALIQAALGAADDPFRLVALSRETASALVDEFRSVPLTGGRRVVSLRDATDQILPELQRALASPADALLVMEAEELPPRSRLRGYCEGTDGVGALACYAETGADLDRGIETILRAAGLKPDRDAAEFLALHLGNDRGVTQSELAKLALYVAPQTRVTLADAIAVIGDMAGLAAEDAIFAATAGNAALADRALDRALTEGASPIAILRQLLLHLQRLTRIRIAMETDRLSIDSAIQQAKPPIFFRRKPSIAQALARWPASALATAAHEVWRAEFACKQTGAADAILCHHLIGQIATTLPPDSEA